MSLRRGPTRGPSGLWALIYRLRLARFSMPFWRVIVECRPMRARRDWPRDAETGVTGVFVWARSAEEAEGLAMLALEEDGFGALTADAVKAAPAARPRRRPAAVARTDMRYLPRLHSDEPLARPPRRGARARDRGEE